MNKKCSRIYTIVATLMRPDGSLRLRSDVQKLPYWKYVKENYFAMTPYHMKGGVAASNIKFHMRSHCVAERVSAANISDDNHEAFRQARTDFDKKLQHIWNTIRAMIVSQYGSHQVLA